MFSSKVSSIETIRFCSEREGFLHFFIHHLLHHLCCCGNRCSRWLRTLSALGRRGRRCAGRDVTHLSLGIACGPLSKLSSPNGVHTITNADNRIEVIELKRAIDVPVTLTSNYRNFLGSCLLFEFIRIIDVLQMHTAFCSVLQVHLQVHLQSHLLLLEQIKATPIPPHPTSSTSSSHIVQF